MSLVKANRKGGFHGEGVGGSESITGLREAVTSPCLGGSRLSSPKTTNEIRPFLSGIAINVSKIVQVFIYLIQFKNIFGFTSVVLTLDH